MANPIEATVLVLGEQSEMFLGLLKKNFSTIYQLAHIENKEEFLKDKGAEIIAVATSNNVGMSKEMIDALPKLQIIASFGVGYDSIDVDYAKQRGIQVTNTPNVLNDCVADTAMMLTYAVARQLIQANTYVKKGHWTSSFPLTTSLSKKVCGILGMGNIGEAIAKRAEASGMEIIYHNRTQKNHVDYQYIATLEELAKQADFLILALPSTGETQHIINASILEKMKPSAYLINIARGSVVDEKALIESLKDKQIAGAGLDVFETEPCTESPLFEMENVVLTPHYASGTHETRLAMAELVCENLIHFFNKEPLITPL
ncbi:2-hydroxyacid dehydrogenase [Acinetobacter nectaris]|uniref:2-hydroxyacid dehydrogenase n=1 Tax=Acinetobacter nectaris TaxID=1219382 RepID=UPI001F479B40|nr:2-hydroxyacid dehydrogenase [Acinetobacter nectaris]MCF9046648.1 2-hydroxyacid dehydrogenase [Acinetobacter nectaris]